MKEKIFIFGAGHCGRSLLPDIEKDYDVISFLDNDSQRWTNNGAGGYAIYSPEKVKEIPFDRIIVTALTAGSRTSIIEQLHKLGVDKSKIINYHGIASEKSRITFLESLAKLFHEQDIKGSVAEGGVFQGDFAKEINRLFPEKTLYLFDTFSGFDKRDVELDRKFNCSSSDAYHFAETSIVSLLQKLPYPEVCEVRKGYFPETAEGIEDTFCFVNLDFDLYLPTLAGLEFFYPRMVAGGVILVHDFFNTDYMGVKKAIEDFSQKMGGLKLLPIGDSISIAICC